MHCIPSPLRVAPPPNAPPPLRRAWQQVSWGAYLTRGGRHRDSPFADIETFRVQPLGLPFDWHIAPEGAQRTKQQEEAAQRRKLQQQQKQQQEQEQQQRQQQQQPWQSLQQPDGGPYPPHMQQQGEGPGQGVGAWEPGTGAVTSSSSSSLNAGRSSRRLSHSLSAGLSALHRGGLRRLISGRFNEYEYPSVRILAPPREVSSEGGLQRDPLTNGGGPSSNLPRKRVPGNMSVTVPEIEEAEGSEAPFSPAWRDL